MTWLLGTLAGTRWGRTLAIWVAGTAAALAVLWVVFARGKAARRAEETRERLKGLQRRMEVDREISEMDAPARRDALRRWVRD